MLSKYKTYLTDGIFFLKEQLWASLKQNEGNSKDNNEQESSFFCQTHQVKWLFVLFKVCTLLCSVAEGEERAYLIISATK